MNIKTVGDAADAIPGIVPEVGKNVLIFGINEALKDDKPSPPKRSPSPAVTVTHQIKHKSVVAAFAGAVVGAVVTAVVTAAAVVVGALLLPKLAAVLGVSLVFAGSAALAFCAEVIVAFFAGKWVGEPVSNWVTSLLEPSEAKHGPVMKGSPNVLLEGRRAGRAGMDPVACTRHSSNPPPLIAEGARWVHVNGAPLARIDDRVTCSGVLGQGTKTVLIGGPTEARLKITGRDFLRWQELMIILPWLVIMPTKGFDELVKSGWRYLGRHTINALKEGYKLAIRTAQALKRGVVDIAQKGAQYLSKKWQGFRSALQRGADLAAKEWQAAKETTRAMIDRGKEIAQQTKTKINKYATDTKVAIERAAQKGAELAEEGANKIKTFLDDLNKPKPPPPPPPPHPTPAPPPKDPPGGS